MCCSKFVKMSQVEVKEEVIELEDLPSEKQKMMRNKKFLFKNQV